MDESVELRHELAEKILGSLVRDHAILADQARRELDVRLDRIHLRRVAERKNAAQVLLSYRRADPARCELIATLGTDDRRG